MFSRVGRSTTQHFLAFQTAAAKEKNMNKDDDEDGDQFNALMMGDANRMDLHSKIAQILEEDPDSTKEVKRRGLAEKFILGLNDGLPTDLKAEAAQAKPLSKSAAFVSPSRD